MGFSMLNMWNQNVRKYRDPAFMNEFAYNMSGVPILGDMLRWEDSRKYMRDYMSAYGLDWSKVQYPSLLAGAGNLGRAGTGAFMGSSFVSSNLSRLYDSGYRTDPHHRDVMYG